MSPDLFAQLAGGLRGSVARDVPLAPLTTYEVGGPAELLVVPADDEDARVVVQACRAAGAPLTVLGAGSNVLVDDAGVRGVVLRMAGREAPLALTDDVLAVGAGAADGRLADFAAAQGVAGFVYLADIPGTVGGAVLMNAGNNDGEVAERLLDVTWLDPAGDRHVTPVAECRFSYRTSRFREAPCVVLSARWRADRRADPAQLRAQTEENRRARAGRFPTERRNCGSVFKRPPGDFAGRLIEAAGCKGLRVGAAQVSQQHAGFIVNLGGATAADIRALVAAVQQRVFEQSGVRLEREVVYLGQDSSL